MPVYTLSGLTDGRFPVEGKADAFHPSSSTQCRSVSECMQHATYYFWCSYLFMWSTGSPNVQQSCTPSDNLNPTEKHHVSSLHKRKVENSWMYMHISIYHIHVTYKYETEQLIFGSDVSLLCIRQWRAIFDRNLVYPLHKNINIVAMIGCHWLQANCCVLVSSAFHPRKVPNSVVCPTQYFPGFVLKNPNNCVISRPT